MGLKGRRAPGGEISPRTGRAEEKPREAHTQDPLEPKAAEGQGQSPGTLGWGRSAPVAFTNLGACSGWGPGVAAGDTEKQAQPAFAEPW